MTKREMMKIVCSQLAIDYNCTPEVLIKMELYSQ